MMRFVEKALYLLLICCALALSVRSVLAAELPHKVTGVQATDGSSSDKVVVSWNHAVGATAYEVYRATEAFIQGKKLTTTVDTFFEDSSAVPGKWYFYRVVATNAVGSAPTSFHNKGHREADIDDKDGDRDPDSTEVSWGSNPYDPGDHNEKLVSPVFLPLNGFYEKNIFLELLANGTADVAGTITVLDIDGNELVSFPFDITAGIEKDLDMKQWAKDNSYGMIRIDFNDSTPGASLSGRLSNYLRSIDGQSFAFANASELKRTLRGEAFAITNSMNPNFTADAQPVWVEVGNASAEEQEFEFTLFDVAGKSIWTTSFTLAAYASRHIPAGHQFGQGVYLAQLTTKNGALPFIMSESRYGINSAKTDFNYSITTSGRYGSSGPLFVHTSNQDGETWDEWNWVEIANVLENAVDLTVIIRNSFGFALATLPIRLAAKSQAHVDINNYLPKGASGYVEIVASVPGSIVMNSSVYVRDRDANDIQTAYVFEQATPGAADQSGTFNLNLDVINEWAVINTNPQFEVAMFRTGSLNNPSSQDVVLLGSNQGHRKIVGGQNFIQANQNTFGYAAVSASEARTFVSSIIRRREVAGRIDFVLPTKLH